MFIKTSIFKKLINKAYKDGALILGHDDNNNAYIISSGWWTIWITEDMLPKKEKSIIIEICGDLPRNGDIYKFDKNGYTQYELKDNPAYNLPERFKESEREFYVTGLINETYEKLVRVLQEEKTGEIRFINNMIVEAVEDGKADEENGETEAIGPITSTGEVMYWGSNVCYLAVTHRDPNLREEAFWGSLSSLSIPE